LEKCGKRGQVKKKKLHPKWWIQRSITDSGFEIKIVMKVSHSRHIPEHTNESCCLEGERTEEEQYA
jgi:hypothetical protein